LFGKIADMPGSLPAEFIVHSQVSSINSARLAISRGRSKKELSAMTNRSDYTERPGLRLPLTSSRCEPCPLSTENANRQRNLNAERPFRQDLHFSEASSFQLPDGVVSRGRRMASSGRLARVLQRLHSTSSQPRPPLRHWPIVGDGCAGPPSPSMRMDQASAVARSAYGPSARLPKAPWALS
jgi:hypothetical protein